MEIIIIIVALFASILTFFSGFGLGTILLPVFSIFFELQVAIAMTAIVHLFNNLFKISFLTKEINWEVFKIFGITAFVGAILGAFLMNNLVVQNINYDFNILNYQFKSSLIQITIGLLIIIFAIIDLFPNLSDKLKLTDKSMRLGGFISGFFGGLSGHQGALRSMFLIKSGLEKASFIATGVMIGVVIDLSRILVYSNSIFQNIEKYDFKIILIALVSSSIGVLIGIKLLKKVTIDILKYLVLSFLVIFGFLMILGLV